MKFFNGHGEKRKFFQNLRHFGNTRQISVACLSLCAFVPAALLVAGIACMIALYTHPGHGSTATGIAVFGGTSSLIGFLLVAKGKIVSLLASGALLFGMATGGAAQPPQMTPEQLNAIQRGIVLSQSVEMQQPIFQQSINPAQQLGPLVIPAKGVGLVKRFKVVVSGTIQNTDAAVDATAGPYGIQNVLSNITLQDLNQNIRINTHGPHLHGINTMKGRWPFASALQAADWTGAAPLLSAAASYGANFPVLVGLTGVVHGTNKAFRMVYDVPLAYSDDDLRGAVYANVVNAVMNLSLTINPAGTAFVGAAADDTFAVMKAGTCSYLGNLNFTVYQIYLDQLPQGQDSSGKSTGPILPTIDLSTVYELKTTTLKALQAGAEFPVPYANFRDFLSTFVIYNNSGDLNGHGVGADINYWALQSANFTNIWKKFPLDAAQDTRDIMGTDFPAGTYYFSHRRKPISTLQYGNMTLILNPITAGAGAYLNVSYEDFALVNTLTQAGSLAGNAG